MVRRLYRFGRVRVTLIHNPAAGGEGPTPDDLLSALRRYGYDATYCRPDEWDPDRDRTDLVVAAGGDGTVGSVARRLVGRPTPLAVIPVGTANNIAASLGIDVEAAPEGLIARWAETPRRPFDVGRAEAQWGDDWFVESVGCGLFADLMARVKRKKAHGKPPAEGDPAEELNAARAEMRRVLGEARPRAWRVELDGVDCSGRYLLVEAMNIRRIGPGLVLAPGAEVGDGLLDVVFVLDGGEDRARLDAHLRRPASPESAAPLLTVRRASHIVLDPRGDRLHLDDAAWPCVDDNDRGERQPTPLAECRLSAIGGRITVVA